MRPDTVAAAGDHVDGGYHLDGGNADLLSEGNGADRQPGPGFPVPDQPDDLGWKINPCLGPESELEQRAVQLLLTQTHAQLCRPDIGRVLQDLAEGQQSVRVEVMEDVSGYADGSHLTVYELVRAG